MPRCIFKILFSMSGWSADNGRVQGRKQSRPKNCTGEEEKSWHKDQNRWWHQKPTMRPKTNEDTKNQWWHQKPTMTPKPTMTLGNPNNYETRLLSLACCTTCRLFRSQSQMTTDGLTRFGHYGAVGPFGEGPWRGLSKKITGTSPNFWPFTRGPILKRTTGKFVMSWFWWKA